MASTMTSLINHNFGGIRRKDSIFSEDKITCSDCQNIELYYTELNSAVGIRTAKGNVAVNNLIPDNEKVIGLFESRQNNVLYYFVYTETDSIGKLYNFDIDNGSITQLTTFTNATGKAQGENFKQGYIDVFVFSNGEQIKFIYTNTEVPTRPIVVANEEPSDYPAAKKLTVSLTDNLSRTVKGLGIANIYGRLWVFDDKTLWWSKSENIADFHNNQSDTTLVTRAGYIEFSKSITAIHEYLGSLAVFHKDSSSLVVETNETSPLFKATDESPGGCASYDSLVFHGTDLFFYDDTKKGVYSFQQVINGDKTLGDNIAYDIQDELMSINKNDLYKIRALSVVTSDRNEVWFLTPIETTYEVKAFNEQEEIITITKKGSIILIYDYIRGEWIKRKCQEINSIAVLNSVLFSGGEQVYQEYTSNYFNGDYIQHHYICTIMNLGTDNTLKITKFAPRITIDSSQINHFYVKYVKNYNLSKKPKVKELSTKLSGNILVYDSGDTYDSGKTYKPGGVSGIIKIPSATFKALEITFYTTDRNQFFTIKAIEFSKIKVKQI